MGLDFLGLGLGLGFELQVCNSDLLEQNLKFIDPFL